MTQTKKHAIVCVDDDPFILQMLGFQLNKLLSSKGVLLELFSNPTEVVECVDMLKSDGIEIKLLFADFNMPQMSGAELIKTVKAYDPSLVCIMLSGEADSKEVDELKELQLIAAFVSKPWNESELVDILEKYI